MTSDPVSSQPVPSYFLQEASELLQQMNDELQTLNQDFNVQRVYALMRIAHTLKGAAASVGLDSIKTTVHSLENVFRALCSPSAQLTPAVESLVFEGYSCLQLLLSAQIAEAQIDEASILDRMADVVARLEKHLGSRFGQDGYLPTSSELGVDITQSVFEKGVTKRLQELETALKNPDPETLVTLLQTQADVFSGLAESFNLPGFGQIVETTLAALHHRPELVIQIAEIALEDYRAGKDLVLKGDRTQGGEPSLMLKKLAEKPSTKPERGSWIGQVWNVLNQPIPGTAPHPKSVQQTPSVHDTATNDELLSPSQPATEVVSVNAPPLPEPVEEDPPLDFSPPPVPPAPVQAPAVSNLKVPIEYFEQINDVMGDLLTQQNRQALYNNQLATTVKTLLSQLEQQQQRLTQLQSQAALETHHLSQPAALTADHQFDALELDHYSELQLQIQTSLDSMVQQTESAEAIELFVRNSNQALERQQRLLKTLRETLVETRMQPIGSVFERFRQVLGRLQAQEGKPVNLVLEGGDVLVDKMIVDRLYEPLLHLVRNAYAHGIEKPIERQQYRKEEDATIRLSAQQHGQRLIISVRDNGRGLNLNAIQQKAIDSGLATLSQVQQYSPAQISNFIFEPGFSTTVHTNDLSGRGFGLDAVRAQIESLQGIVTVTHKPKQETCFSLEIPTNLTIAKLLLCQTGETIYTFMTDAIEQILMPKPEQLKERDGNKMLSWQFDSREQLIPVISLAKALHYNAALPHTHWQETAIASATALANPIIIIRHRDRFLGIESDQLLGEQELVIRSLGEIESAPPYFYGCSILPDGRLSLVIDGAILALDILQRPSLNSATSISRTQRQPPAIAEKKSILVIDDSITVRNTLTQGLQKAGYLVIQAKEGNEALQKLEQEQVTAILCDLEMPGMNGFDFLRARRRLPHIAAIPTIMLTSRTGDKHRQLSKELGATSYLTKPYLIPQLLKTINAALEAPAKK